jgi:hypothetical protein
VGTTNINNNNNAVTNINTGTSSSAVNIGGTGTITIGGNSVSIGAVTGNTTVNIANSSTVSNTVQIGNSNTTVGIGGAADGAYSLRVYGNLRTNAINETSDQRFKKDVQTVDNALDKALALRGVNYYWNQQAFPDLNFDSTKQLGVIAQEVEKVVPEVVRTDAKGFKSVEYSKITAILIEALKAQQKMIEELKQDVKKLKAESGKVEKLEAEMAEFRKTMEELKKSQPANK